MPEKHLLSATVLSHATNISRTKIENLGLIIAKKLEFSPGKSALQKIVSALNGKVLYKDLSKKTDKNRYSMEVVKPNDFTIYASDASSSLRDNYIFAHEIAHYILHTDFGEKPTKFKRYADDLLEWEANWFAASFLMPEDEFIKISSKYNGSILKIAAHFNITEVAVEMRSERLGL